MKSTLLLLSLLLLLFLVSACSSSTKQNEVVVYTSVDQHYSEPILMAFEKETGIAVRIAFDVEASKTTGLVNRLIAEQKHPKADVFWNGEFVQTVRLASQGILARYKAPSTDQSYWSDSQNRWSTFGGRLRVLISNKEKITASSLPKSLNDFLNPKYPADKIGIALPLFGTTATHAAALWAQMGEANTSKFFHNLQERGVSFVNGNSVVRDAVSSGQLWFGLTDSDDACAAVAKGKPITITYLNQSPDNIGTLVIPNTVALIAGGPNPENGRRLIEYLLSHKTKKRLIELGWFHIYDGHITTTTECPLPSPVHMQNISPSKIVESLEPSQNYLRKLLLR